MDNKYFYVYKWFNVETGEIFYIGKGCGNRYRDISKRNKDFLEYYNNNPCQSEIIEYFDTEEEAFEREHELIIYYKELNQVHANLDDGGKGGCHFVWTEQMKDYWSRNNPMKRPEQRERMSKNNPMYNPEIAEKVAQKMRRAVIINNQYFISVIDAAQKLKKAEPTIREWCQKGYNPQGELCRYADEEQKSLPENFKPKNMSAKKVIIDEQYYFDTMTEALSITGGYLSGLSKALKQNKNIYRGHTCRYANQQPSQENSNNSILEGSTTNG